MRKCNHVLCISIFIAHLMHWKSHYPSLYEKLRYMSEEEIEIMHSMIRPHVRGQKTVKQLVREVYALGSSAKMLPTWRHPKGRKVSARNKAGQLTPEVIGDASKSSLTLSVPSRLTPSAHGNRIRQSGAHPFLCNCVTTCFLARCSKQT